MTWSTRQLAELAGTSVRAVRHYHDIGLLAELERASNGYKRYGVAHLLRITGVNRRGGGRRERRADSRVSGRISSASGRCQPGR